MDLDIANKLRKFSSEIFSDTPLIVGGYVRDYIFNLEEESVDIDLTTNNSDITRLAVGFAIENNYYYKVFNDLHVTIYTDKYKNLDFSSNFNSKNAIDFYKSTKFSNKKYYEVISRDFTINTLHKSMFDDKIIDLLDVGLKDCENKIIKSVSNPEICFNDDPRRAYRAISLAARLNLSIDGSIIDFILNNSSLFMPLNNSSISETYITSTIDGAIGVNDDILLDYLVESRLLKNIPLIGKFKDLIISNNMVSNYLDLLK